MGYQLFIKPEIYHADSHGGYLKPFEFVRGEFASFGISVKNLGTDSFPGGTVTKIALIYGEQRLISTTFETQIQIKDLKPQEQSETDGTIVINPMLDGMVWAQVHVEAMDGEEIEFFQVEDEPAIGTELWYGSLYVINRERLIMIDLLKEMIDPKGE